MEILAYRNAGVAQLVELQPSKLEAEGSSRLATPAPETMEILANRNAGVAQLVELQPSKLVVEGSSPFARSRYGTDRVD